MLRIRADVCFQCSRKSKAKLQQYMRPAPRFREPNTSKIAALLLTPPSGGGAIWHIC